MHEVRHFILHVLHDVFLTGQLLKRLRIKEIDVVGPVQVACEVVLTREKSKIWDFKRNRIKRFFRLKTQLLEFSKFYFFGSFIQLLKFRW